MAAVVIIGGGRGLKVEACHRNQPNKGTLLLHKPLLTYTLTFLLNSCTQATRRNVSVIKVGVMCMGLCA